MKIRWTSESIRVRITPTELSRLQGGDFVQEILDFPGGGGWQRRIIPSGNVACAFGDRETLSITLTPADLTLLSDETQEGVYFHEADPSFRYYIEKDFPCAHPRPSEALESLTEAFAPNTAFNERKAKQN
ncbi:MAG: hypothetical protein NT023_14220 [Armatimonadetes bacterium]|nr:hypothetical protein [Armatimonadota bacterium]